MTSQESTDKPKPDRVEINSDEIEEVFKNYGIALPEIERAIVELIRDNGWDRYTPTEAFRNDLYRSFQTAYLQESGKTVIPEAVDAAAKDAAYWVTWQYTTPCNGLADKIVPAYAALVASVIPGYSWKGLDPHGTVQFGPPPGDDSPPRQP